MNPAHPGLAIADSTLGDHVAFSALIVYGIQLLKKSHWCKWLTADTVKLNRWATLVASFLAAVGISFGIEGNFQSGGHVLIAFPPADQMFDLAKHWAAQFALNQLLYKGAVDRESPAQ